MPHIRPFPSLLLTSPELAQIVVAPPYDTLNSAEARQYAKNNRHTFLHITKPEIDLAADSDPYGEDVYAQGAKNLQQFIERGDLAEDEQDCYYIYRITNGQHVQTGIAVALEVAALENNWVRWHELTRPEKVRDRARLMQAQQANISPVLLTYRQQDSIQQLTKTITQAKADYSVLMTDQSQHELWRVSDEQMLALLSEHLNALTNIYIADGHHRCQTAIELAKQNKKNNAQYFLAVLFADEEMQILSYNRVVRDLNGHSAQQFIELLSQHASCEPSQEAVMPRWPHEFGLYLDGTWYRLSVEPTSQQDILSQLPVNLLQQHIIEPLLQIKDQRIDKRIDFVGGDDSLQTIMQQVNSGEMAAGFSLYPTTVEQLLEVADHNKIMPPKSTWFAPKLADGFLGFLF